LVTWIAFLMHSRQKMCPQVVAVIAFICPKHIAHSRLTIGPPLLSAPFVVFPLSFGVLVLGADEDVVVVVVVVRWSWSRERQEVDEEDEDEEEVVVEEVDEVDRDDLTPMISSSSELMGEPISGREPRGEKNFCK